MQRVLNQEFGFPPAELVSMEGGKTNRLWRYGDWVVKLYSTGGPDRQQAIQALELQAALAGTGLPIPAPAGST